MVNLSIICSSCTDNFCWKNNITMSLPNMVFLPFFFFFFFPRICGMFLRIEYIATIFCSREDIGNFLPRKMEKSGEDSFQVSNFSFATSFLNFIPFFAVPQSIASSKNRSTWSTSGIPFLRYLSVLRLLPIHPHRVKLINKDSSRDWN